MFNKLSPTPITNQTHRRLLIFSMIWFFSGAWIDSSAHTYLIDDIETFFTPWHGVLYSGYAFSVLVAMYIKNKMKDYKFCLLYTSPSPRDRTRSRMPSSA